MVDDRTDEHPESADQSHTWDAEAPGATEQPDGGEPPAGTDAALVPAAVSAEHERLVAERQARREARMAALSPASEDPSLVYQQHSSEAGAPAAAATQVAAEPVKVIQRSTDQFAGSLGLFLLRLVVAAIMGYHGVQKLLDIPGTATMLATTVLPAPDIMAIVIGSAEVLAAIALLFGALTRVAGLGVALVTGGALGFVLWGPWSIFPAGQPGFLGELELLLAAAGLVFFFVGAGGWSVDRGFAARRAADRADG
ncbi:MAG: DoxX family protein [Propioniciclava sp.]|uniref:DoxX family protein n=1 Tax=Propioniciclava sp. TaxID=2038686 RepID=UPI0039E3E471